MPNPHNVTRMMPIVSVSIELIRCGHHIVAKHGTALSRGGDTHSTDSARDQTVRGRQGLDPFKHCKAT